MAYSPIDVCIHHPLNSITLERLRAIKGTRIILIDAADEEAPWAIPNEIQKTTQIIFSALAPENVASASSLKLIQIASAGYSQLLGLDLPMRKIRACNAAGVFDLPIAEWNIAMMINLARDLRGMIRNQESGIWDRPARFQREISGSVVGFWGYGGLARETARLCKCLMMTVHVLARSGIKRRDNIYVVSGHGDPEGKLPDRIFTPAEKQAFLQSLDFLIIALPLTGQSRGLIGEADLQFLRPHAYVLNPARGPIIQEQALLKALRDGWIAGAALDTHYYYPMPPDHPLWRCPNVIMTPHISGSTQTQTFSQRIGDIFIQNVERFVAGQALLNQLSESQLNEV